MWQNASNDTPWLRWYEGRAACSLDVAAAMTKSCCRVTVDLQVDPAVICETMWMNGSRLTFFSTIELIRDSMVQWISNPCKSKVS